MCDPVCECYSVMVEFVGSVLLLRFLLFSQLIELITSDSAPFEDFHKDVMTITDEIHAGKQTSWMLTKELYPRYFFRISVILSVVRLELCPLFDLNFIHCSTETYGVEFL